MIWRRSFKAMGSPCALQLEGLEESQAAAAAASVEADIARIEARYSRYREDSLLASINRAASAASSHALDAETAALLDYADTCYRLSDARFDITSGVLRQVWYRGRSTVPSAEEIDSARQRMGWRHLVRGADSLRFRRPGMELDLGGIAKEYAADRAAALLIGQGAHHACIDLGGDLHLTGPHADGRPWRVGIRHPREPGRLLGELLVERGAVATSGDYERFIELDGCRYSHLLDARTGWPVRGLVSVTVVAEQCVVAGSAATIGMLMGEEGAEWLVELGLPHLWVDDQARCGGSLQLLPATSDQRTA